MQDGRRGGHVPTSAWRGRRAASRLVTNAADDARSNWHASSQEANARHDRISDTISSPNASAPAAAKASMGGPMRQSRLKPAPTASGSIPLALLSSPSRGIDTLASNLTQQDTQERFRDHISERLLQHVDRYGQICTGEQLRDVFVVALPPSASSANKAKTADSLAQQRAFASGCASSLVHNRAALASLQEVLLLVRRLREGCVAARRTDSFTIDVYILSVLLSILVGDSIQLSASLDRLVNLLAHDPDAKESSRAEEDIGALVTLKVPPIDLAHAASLSLLHLSSSGGRTERIGGQGAGTGIGIGASQAWLRQRLALKEAGHRAGKHIALAVHAHLAIVRNEPLVLRRLLLDDQTTLWQRALLVRVVPEMRNRAWHTLSRAYIHLAIDARLLGKASIAARSDADFVERLLLIDVVVAPALDSERREASQTTGAGLESALASLALRDRTSTPDEWDEEGGHAELHASDAHVRANRVRDCFRLYGLPAAASDKIDPDCIDAMHPWQGRIATQAGTRVVKLR